MDTLEVSGDKGAKCNLRPTDPYIHMGGGIAKQMQYSLYYSYKFSVSLKLFQSTKKKKDCQT
jgi:hypothetical protein